MARTLYPILYGYMNPITRTNEVTDGMAKIFPYSPTMMLDYNRTGIIPSPLPHKRFYTLYLLIQMMKMIKGIY